MPATVPLQTLLTKIRQRGEIEYSQHVTDDELTGIVNAAVSELGDLIGQASGSHYGSKPYSFTTTASETYALPTDFLQFKLLEAQWQSGYPQRWVPIRHVVPGEYNLVRGPYAIPVCAGYKWNLYYDLDGSNLLILPPPQSGITVRLTYVPVTPVLADTGTIDCAVIAATDVVTINGTALAATNTPATLASEITAAFAAMLAPVAGTSTVVITQKTSDPVIWSCTNPLGLSPANVSWTRVVDDFNGWLEFVVLKSTIMVKNKSGYDIQLEMALLDQMRERITRATWQRNVGNSGHVADNGGIGGWWGSGLGGGGW